MIIERPLLFRGLVKDEKDFHYNQWIYGSVTYCEDDMESNIINSEFKCWVSTETVGQYTGQDDSEGTKIFEDDVVEVPDDYNTYGFAAGGRFLVIFTGGGFRVTSGKKNRGRGYWLEDGSDYKVIGNIHQNPDLIKIEENE
jgi:uncharacterized phage protein (TIGR01671 family)